MFSCLANCVYTIKACMIVPIWNVRILHELCTEENTHIYFLLSGIPIRKRHITYENQVYMASGNTAIN